MERLRDYDRDGSEEAFAELKCWIKVGKVSYQVAGALCRRGFACGVRTSGRRTPPTPVRRTFEFMARTKAKTGILAGAILFLAGGAATLVSGQSIPGPSAAAIARESKAAYAALSSYSDNGKSVGNTGSNTITTTFSIRLKRPALYRIDWTTTAAFFSSKGSVWSDGSGNFLRLEKGGQDWAAARPEKMKDRETALASATGVSSSAAATVPAEFFQQNWGDVLGLAAAESTRARREHDERIDGVNCYVLTYTVGPTRSHSHVLESKQHRKVPVPGFGKTKTTVWIGMKDHLIRQVRTTTEGVHYSSSQMEALMTDKDVKAILRGQKKAATPEAIAALRAQMKQVLDKEIVTTQTHENISVNPNLSASDFRERAGFEQEKAVR